MGENRSIAVALVSLALQILSQLFLRFYPLAQSDHPIWAEMDGEAV